jgi:drug/metabolite transporter (DMT)-like permease
LVRVHAALLSVALLFSANYVIAKLGMRELSPMAFAWLRIAGAAILLGIIERHDPAPRLPREEFWRVTGFAILAVVVNAPLFLAGLALTSVPVAAILITTIPVFALAAAIALGRERATATRIGGISLAGAGAVLVVGGESFTGTWRSLAGVLMILANCLSYALYLVVSKPAMTRLSARRVVARMFAIGTVVLLPISAYWLMHQDWRSVTPKGWIALGLVIVGPTVAAYLLNAWALRHADSSVVAAYTYIQPVLASLLGAIFLGEHVRPIVAVAAVMIIGGVWLASRSTSPRAESRTM